MLTIKGVYDGKTIRPLPGEPLPQVQGTIPVEITFLSEAEVLHSWGETLAKLQAERAKIPPLEGTVKDLIVAGRDDEEDYSH